MSVAWRRCTKVCGGGPTPSLMPPPTPDRTEGQHRSLAQCVDAPQPSKEEHALSAPPTRQPLDGADELAGAQVQHLDVPHAVGHPAALAWNRRGTTGVDEGRAGIDESRRGSPRQEEWAGWVARGRRASRQAGTYRRASSSAGLCTLGRAGRRCEGDAGGESRGGGRRSVDSRCSQHRSPSKALHHTTHNPPSGSSAKDVTRPSRQLSSICRRAREEPGKQG